MPWRLQPWGLCSGLSATQQGQPLCLRFHPPGPPGADSASTVGLSTPQPWGPHAPLRKPKNKPPAEALWSHPAWSPVSSVETPRGRRPAHRRPRMLGPQPLPPPAQEPNHSLSGDGPPRPLMRLPAQDQPPGSGAPLTNLGGRRLPAPSVSLAVAWSGHLSPRPPPPAGMPFPLPSLPNERHGGADPRPWVSAMAGPSPRPRSPHSCSQQGLCAAALGGQWPPRPLLLPAALAAKPCLPPPSV